MSGGIKLLKKNLVLCITIALFLSGCGEANEKTAINQDDKQEITSNNKQEKVSDSKPEVNPDKKQESTSDNKGITNSSSDKKLAEAPKSDSKPEAFTPLELPETKGLSTKAIPWSWLYSSKDSATLLAKYKGYGFGDTSKKIIYLTFDEGYENGYTANILNTLKANNVHATFFVTKPYVTGSFNGVSDAELLKRMINEGHIIGNHSVQHKSMATFTSEDAFNAEITGVEDAVNNIPGCKMSKYFRPPEGTFSELSLYYTQKLGYKSMFFSLAYQDYDVDNQPELESSKEKLLKNTRDGTICLLHAVSKTNATILDSLIKEWKNRGYEFKTLDDIHN